MSKAAWQCHFCGSKKKYALPRDGRSLVFTRVLRGGGQCIVIKACNLPDCQEKARGLHSQLTEQVDSPTAMFKARNTVFGADREAQTTEHEP